MRLERGDDVRDEREAVSGAVTRRHPHKVLDVLAHVGERERRRGRLDHADAPPLEARRLAHLDHVAGDRGAARVLRWLPAQHRRVRRDVAHLDGAARRRRRLWGCRGGRAVRGTFRRGRGRGTDMRGGGGGG